MTVLNQSAHAINAAGISDSMQAIGSNVDRDRTGVSPLIERFDGTIGIVMQIADAGALMEEYRVRLGASATWGCELPYIYDAWDAIASEMWARLGQEPLQQIVIRAIESA